MGLRETQRARHSRGEALTVRRIGQSEQLGMTHAGATKEVIESVAAVPTARGFSSRIIGKASRLWGWTATDSRQTFSSRKYL